ncbi:hypothetical protein Salat_1213700 [Sesamum alatum]|uniref:Uncharacterized protein n=1 Tax=Sesamum alatum TaxID=300844 RepID=A0AAE1YFC0_9LAMI|nr:hypothetical protein Salat_1213700 [Sesamum alatum]
MSTGERIPRMVRGFGPHSQIGRCALSPLSGPAISDRGPLTVSEGQTSSEFLRKAVLLERLQKRARMRAVQAPCRDARWIEVGLPKVWGCKSRGWQSGSFVPTMGPPLRQEVDMVTETLALASQDTNRLVGRAEQAGPRVGVLTEKGGKDHGTHIPENIVHEGDLQESNFKAALVQWGPLGAEGEGDVHGHVQWQGLKGARSSYH